MRALLWVAANHWAHFSCQQSAALTAKRLSARLKGSRFRHRSALVFQCAATMPNDPNTSQTPFQIDVADRVKRLPPYLFGKINDLKYRKRRAGVDIIDLGMGNPSDVPEAQVIDKFCEAARDERNHRYSVSNGLRNLRREKVIRGQAEAGRRSRKKDREPF
ncbi:MAG: hypothetical protein ACRELG_24385 [Gemmataceae bacterium]